VIINQGIDKLTLYRGNQKLASALQQYQASAAVIEMDDAAPEGQTWFIQSSVA
jgi:hypothetical protein